MTSRTKLSRRTTSSNRRSTPAKIALCITEALEDRKLMAADLVTVGLGGAAANGDSGDASVSADGRFVVFDSTATNLVAGDTNAHRDVFLRDRQAGTTVLISKNPTTGDIGNGDSLQPFISADGNFVTFESRASNLLSGDTLGFKDVFRFNVQTGALQLVSATNTAGTTFAGGNSGDAGMSSDGRFVAFTSFAANLGGVDGNGENDVYLRDMQTGANTLVSVNTGNVSAGNALSFDPTISSDGRFVSFRSDASNLAANDTNGARDSFVRDMQSHVTTLVSVNLAGASANASSDSNAVSGDGRFVVFQSKATDLVTNDGNNNSDVFLRDTQTNTTRLLSINRFGTSSAGGASEFPAISQDGSFASFSSTAPDIVAGDTNGREDVFLRDLKRGPLTLVSANTAGAASNGRSFDPFLSQDGNFVVFSSDATDLSGTIATAGKTNIYLVNTPAPTTSTDTVPPTVTFGQVLPINPGATTVDFTVNLADNVGLDTVSVGNLTATKTSDNSTLTAALVSVVGTGTSAVATYRITFATPVEQNAGNYLISVPANAIKDAAGNSATPGVIGGGTTPGTTTFVLSTTPGGGTTGGTIGDPNGPNLVLTSPSKVPGEVIGGSRKGKFKFHVQNLGPGLLNAQTEFKLFLSADQTLDAGDVNVAILPKFLKKIKVGKAKGISIKFTYPTTIGDGNFFVLAQADSSNQIPESNESDNVLSSATAVLVRQPFVDLQPTFVSKPSKFTPGTVVSVTTTIKNNGNVSFKAATPIDLVLTSTGAVDDSSVILASITPTLSIHNGHSKSVKFKVTLPAGLATGAYQMGVKVDTTNAIAESEESNNIATSFVFNV